ncbi:MAG: serine/threonine-protein kinase [Cyanobacteria bacterium J06649_4]
MTDPLIGQQFSERTTSETQQLNAKRYLITALLGKQTGRRTYKATDVSTQVTVVIKLVLFGPDFTWSDLKLFEREAETLKSLDNPSIPSCLNAFEVETPIGKGFALVQTFIEARSLQQQVNAGRTFSDQDLCEIATQVLNILIYLHERHPPIVHRDIKPSNILITYRANNRIKNLYLIDFGAVQTTPSIGTMTIVGTYGYMPVEQFSGRALPASDLYSLGATLIYLAASKHPAELIQANLQLDFEQYVELPKTLIRWLKRLTATDLTQRTASAREALSELSHQAGRETDQRPLPLLAPSKAAEQPITFSDAPLMLNDIELLATQEQVSIHLSPHRLIEKELSPSSSAFFILFLQAIAMAIALSISIIGALILPVPINLLCLLTAFCIFLVLSPPPTSKNRQRQSNEKKTSIHLWISTDGWMSFSFAEIFSRRKSKGNTASAHLKPTRVPVIAIKTGLLGRQVRFIFNDGGQFNRVLVIRGNRKEIQFLYQHLCKYKAIATQWQ